MESVEPTNLDNKSKIKSKQQFFIFLAIAILLIVGVVLITMNGNKSSTSNNQQSTQKPEAGYLQNNAQLRDYKSSATIQLTAKGPLPSTLIVHKDVKIAFQNLDNKSHTIAIVPSEKVPPLFFNNRPIIVGGGYVYVIHTSLTFHYYYLDNPKLVGVVEVR